VLVLRPSEFHYNTLGIVAAGVATDRLGRRDVIAFQTSLPEPTIAPAVNLSVHLVRQLAATNGEVHAEAQAVHLSRTSTVEARLVDANGQLFPHTTAAS
jgi:acyl-coenzyme A thioesterase PaaI-like protein